MGILKEGIIRVNLYLYCSNKYLVVLFWELRVIQHQILCTLILTDDSLTLDSLYQKISGQITAITARDMKYLRRKGEILWLMQIYQKPESSDIHLEEVTYETSSQRYIFVCSCELCMHVTVLYNLSTCISIFLPKKSDEESLTPVTVWVVCDVETPKGRELLYSAIRQLVILSDMVYFNLH